MIRFAAHARLTSEAVKLLTFAFKGHKFTPDGVTVPLKGPKVMPQVEEMIGVLEQALAKKKPGTSGERNGGKGAANGSLGSTRAAQPTGTAR